MVGDAFEMHENIEEDEMSIIRSVGLIIVEPAMKARREGMNLVIEIGLPGIRNRDINLSLKKDRLSVSAEKREISSEVNEGFFRSERMLKYYKLSEKLPSVIMPERATVRFENGVLRIDAPLDEDGGVMIKTSINRGGE